MAAQGAGHLLPARGGWSAKAMAHPVRTLLIVYAVSRLIGWGCLWVAANDFQNPAGVGTDDPGVLDLLPLWDTEWYERIARHGYPVPLPGDPETGVLTYSEWAFYPLFPMILRALMALGVPFLAAGVLLNLVLGAASTVLIWATLRHGVHAEPRPERDRLALLAAVLWCFYPATTVMLKPYTEALATVLIARWRKHDEVGLGTVLGSNLFNGLFIIGLTILIRPVDVRLAEIGRASCRERV